MKTRTLTVIAAAVLVSACAAPRRPEFSGGYPVYDCPPHLEGQVRIAAEVFPMAAQPAREYGVRTVGALRRRLALAVEPAGLGRDDRIVWSSVTISSFGGTFVEWSGLQTDSLLLSPDHNAPLRDDAHDEREQSSSEIATVRSVPGQIKITRIAREDSDLAGVHSIDVSVMPGGSVVDDVVFTSLRLWNDDGSPLRAHDARFELSPVRHPPGLDVVQASIQLDFIVRLAESREEWACSAETRTTLVDQDSLRQPFWDLGLAPKNSARREWLALFDSEIGAVRLMFDSPATANSFAEWLRASRATEIEDYTIGAFRQSNAGGSRPYGPVDAETLRTFRPLRSDDLASIKVGPVAEP